MTFRLPISVEKVIWRDGQKVNQSDIVSEQSYNIQTQSAIVHNFFGSGLIPNVPERTYLFHSDQLTPQQSVHVAANRFDGIGIKAHAQPSDKSLGCQLEITLQNSIVCGRKSVKVLIVGLDFDNNLQYETFYFHRNETQISKKHFVNILGLIFNNFKGNSNGSRVYGGTITIQEAHPMHLSKSLITSSQNVEPNLFFRDLKLYSLSLGANITTALKQVITDVIGNNYSVDNLNIKTTAYKNRTLPASDITTRYGQKFLSTSNNIQKIRILLGATLDGSNKYDWSGDLVVTIYALQTSATNSSYDVIPSNAIDFQPDPTPLAQMTITQSMLNARGIVLNDVEQPVDFVFSNTKIANSLNSGIEANKYYMVCIQRIGDTSIGNLFTVTGNTATDKSKFTFFNGVVWTNVSNENMWYEIWSDNFKVADGMGVDSGINMSVPKIAIDEDTGGTIDYIYDTISFVNSGQNQLNYAIVESVKTPTTKVQDARTGNNVYSKEKYNAVVSTISSSSLNTLKTTSDPIILGCGMDMNNKSAYSYTDSYGFGMAVKDKFYIVNPKSALLAINLIGCKLTPNISHPQYIYRIVDVQEANFGLGDVNGDGKITIEDLIRAQELVGESLTKQTTQTSIVNGAIVGSSVITSMEVLRADVNQDGTVGIDDIENIRKYVNNDSATTAGGTFKTLILTLENNIGRCDEYYDYSDQYIRENPYSSNLLPIANLTDDQIKYYGNPKPVNLLNDIFFNMIPFQNLTFAITNENDYWDGSLVFTTYRARFLPCTFTNYDKINSVSENLDNLFNSKTRYMSPEILGGHNDMYVPGNLIIGGQILRNANQYHNVDYETATVVIELPEGHGASSIDIFHNFVMDTTGTGYTKLGYPAMRFADGSFVTSEALGLNQLRFSAAVQAYSPNFDGYTTADGYGTIVDPIMGIQLLNETGVLQFKMTNLKCDTINSMLRTKVQITVELKKSGWLNTPLTISYTKSGNIATDLP